MARTAAKSIPQGGPRLTFLGASQNVTGSRYLLEVKGRRLLVSIDGEAKDELAKVSGVASVQARGQADGRWDYALDADEAKFNRMLLEILGRTA